VQAVHLPTWDDLDAFLIAFWPNFIATLGGLLIGIPIALAIERHRANAQRRSEVVAGARRVLYSVADDLMQATMIGSFIEHGQPIQTTPQDVGASLTEASNIVRNLNRHDGRYLTSPVLDQSLTRLGLSISVAAFFMKGPEIYLGAFNICSHLSSWASEIADRLVQVEDGKTIAEVHNEMSHQVVMDRINNYRPLA
jgi:hypothetical protein